ncbi:hypothetical protein TNCV_5069571 [Trichonephila clavipes]|nr:hypothetical protein TNCV_5069571 [Trichonephila clavipes]
MAELTHFLDNKSARGGVAPQQCEADWVTEPAARQQVKAWGGTHLWSRKDSSLDALSCRDVTDVCCVIYPPLGL